MEEVEDGSWQIPAKQVFRIACAAHASAGDIGPMLMLAKKKNSLGGHSELC